MRKKITLKDVILLSLEETIDGFVRYDHFINNPGLYAYYGWWNRPLKKNSISQTLRRLRIDGYLDLEEYNNKLVLKLTETGKMEADLRKVFLDEKWDGKWRVIIWDIPEKHHKVRDALRSKLKVWGFVPWQKSVWASKKNVTNIVKDFIKRLGIEQWVVVIETTAGPL